MPEAVLGIDIGTASTKAILFDLSGAEIATASRSYPLSTPQPGWVEQDPEQVWEALVQSLQEVVSRAPGWRIAALALAAQAGSIIPALASGDPAYPMITWLDSRSEGIIRGWQQDGTAEAIHRLSGWHPFPGLPLPTIAWLRAERPEVYARARRYLGAADFLIHRLTGEFSTDLSAAAEMLLVDVETGRWDAALCELGGVDPGRQASLGWAGRSLGGITPEVARLTGLPPGTPVIAGGADQPCATLAMGATGPGKVTLATGTAWVITGVADSPRREAVPARMDLSFHAMPDRWTVSQFLGGFGATVDWWLAQAWQSPDPAEHQETKALYRYLDAALAGEDSTAGSHGLLFLPLSGPSQVAHGKPGGAFVGLQLLHSRADMARAILEGCAYEVRWALEQLGASGLPVTELWVSGGATSSPAWPHILADVAGAPIVLADYANWAALGAAALAGWGVGAFPTLEAGIARLQPPVRRLPPDPTRAGVYAGGFAAYKQSALALTRR